MAIIFTHIRLHLLLIALSMAGIMSAQNEQWLASLDIVNGKIEGIGEKASTIISGEKIHKFHLTLFRSIEGTANTQTFNAINRCIATDETSAIDKEIKRKNGQTTFALLRFRHPDTTKKKGHSCYIIYQRNGPTSFTCAYLEGTATINQLRETFQQ